jgi:hypothetical protein
MYSQKFFNCPKFHTQGLGPEGKYTKSRVLQRGQAWAAPPCGEVAWWDPGVSQVPLCPIFCHKNLKRIFQNFLRNFIFEDFSEIDKRIKTRENKDGTIESEFKPMLQQL